MFIAMVLQTDAVGPAHPGHRRTHGRHGDRHTHTGRHHRLQGTRTFHARIPCSSEIVDSVCMI